MVVSTAPKIMRSPKETAAMMADATTMVGMVEASTVVMLLVLDSWLPCVALGFSAARGRGLLGFSVGRRIVAVALDVLLARLLSSSGWPCSSAFSLAVF